MKSKFKKISDSINIITNNHFESIIEYEGNLWKVIIDNDINNNTLFELSEVIFILYLKKQSNLILSIIQWF